MKEVSQKFKNNIKKYGRQLDVQITFGEQILDKKDINKIILSFNTQLFKSVMHVIEFDSNVKIPKKTNINLKIGVKFGSDFYEYVEFNNYIVENIEEQKDTESYKIIAYDKMIESMIDYDLKVNYPISIRDYIIAICERLSWDTNGIPASFVNSEKILKQDIHSGIHFTYRDVLDEIATITGSFIFLKSGTLQLKYLTDTNQKIDETYCSQDNVNIGEKYFINSLVFSRAEESDNIYRKDVENIELNGLHEFKIADNQILSTNDRVDFIDELFEYLKTVEFYIYDVKSTGILFLEICDKFDMKFKDILYPTIVLNNEIIVEQDIEENLYLEQPNETETEYKYADETDKRIDQAYILVDKQNKKIIQLVNQNTQFEEKIATIEQDVDSITQKVSNMVDFTRTINEKTKLHLNETAGGEGYLLDLKIKGSTENFIYLTPSDNLVPSDTLTPLGDHFTLICDKQRNAISEDAQIFDIWLSEPLRDFNGIYDELQITDGKTQVIRRIGVNEDLSLYILTNEIIEALPTITLKTFEDDTYIYIKEYANLEYIGKYIVKNDYNEAFITKKEADSQIQQTSEEIELSVNKKLEGYSTTTEMNSAIIQKADQITLETNKKMGNYALDNFVSNGDFNNSLNNWCYDGNVSILEKNNFKYCNLQSKTGTSLISQYISSSGFFSNIGYTLTFNIFDKLTNLAIAENGIVKVGIFAYTDEYSEEPLEVVTKNISVSKEEKSVTIDFIMPQNITELLITFSLIPNSGIENMLSLMIGNIVLKSANINENFAKLNIGANEINSIVSQKVGNNEIISKINQSSESISIDANRVSLNRKNNKFNK